MCLHKCLPTAVAAATADIKPANVLLGRPQPQQLQPPPQALIAHPPARLGAKLCDFGLHQVRACMLTRAPVHRAILR